MYTRTWIKSITRQYNGWDISFLILTKDFINKIRGESFYQEIYDMWMSQTEHWGKASHFMSAINPDKIESFCCHCYWLGETKTLKIFAAYHIILMPGQNNSRSFYLEEGLGFCWNQKLSQICWYESAWKSVKLFADTLL